MKKPKQTPGERAAKRKAANRANYARRRSMRRDEFFAKKES